MQKKPNTYEQDENYEEEKKAVSQQKMTWKAVSSHNAYEEASTLKAALLEEGIPAKVRRVRPKDGKGELFILKTGAPLKKVDKPQDSKNEE